MNDAEAKAKELELRERRHRLDVERAAVSRQIYELREESKRAYDLGDGLVLSWNGCEYAHEEFAVTYDPDIDEVDLGGNFRSVPSEDQLSDQALRTHILRLVRSYGRSVQHTTQTNLDACTKRLHKIDATVAWAERQSPEPV